VNVFETFNLGLKRIAPAAVARDARHNLSDLFCEDEMKIKTPITSGSNPPSRDDAGLEGEQDVR
jgi:hypothetical protein